MPEKKIAFVLIHVSPGTEHSVLEQLLKIEDITETYSTFGSWDIITRIETTHMGKLETTITQIRKLKDITQTTTLLAS